MGLKKIIRLFFGELKITKKVGWIIIFILFVLYYIFFLGNMIGAMIYLLIYSLPLIWLATIIGGTIEIIKIMKEHNKKGG